MTPEPASVTVALAHHWMMSMRGGEKVLAALAALFPEAPIHTLVIRPGQIDPALLRHPIHPSWLQRVSRFVPDVQRKALPLLFPAARSLDARGADAVICSDASAIKAIRTRPDALKLCYCHSPMRYVWDQLEEYRAGAGRIGRIGLRLFAARVRRADRLAADSVTAFVANSHCVADRIRRHYGRPSVVIPPPVDTDFEPNDADPEGFYLVLGEHVHYKRHDLAIEACRRLGRPLVVIGTGPLLNAHRARAGPTVRILGWQGDASVRDHLRRCRALLFCGQEDFGMVPVEAQAAGRPVIAYRAGGALDTILEGRTGVFFDAQTTASVSDAILRFESAAPLWPSQRIQQHAQHFSAAAFRDRFTRFYDWCLTRWRTGGPELVRRDMETLDRAAFV